MLRKLLAVAWPPRGQRRRTKADTHLLSDCAAPAPYMKNTKQRKYYKQTTLPHLHAVALRHHCRQDGADVGIVNAIAL